MIESEGFRDLKNICTIIAVGICLLWGICVFIALRTGEPSECCACEVAK